MSTAVQAWGTAPRGRSTWRWAKVGLPVITLAVLVWRLGTSPFAAGVRHVDAGTVAIAFALAVVTTTCAAWRWTVVARGLGVTLPLGTAVAAYYRSLFLNVTLPGGVIGDVHRGISHGRETRDVGRGLRAVAWERTAGQVVQIALTVAVLLFAASPVHDAAPYAALGVVALLGLAVVASRRHSLVTRELRSGLLARGAWPAIVLASAIVVAGHAATFLLAAHAAGTPASVTQLFPIALLVLAAAALPNIGGWGPREGVTAWAFGAAGLGASRGVATAVVYGVVVFVASLPGAAVLAVTWVRRQRVAHA